ncbi:ParB/RepB/Spo0J family partition protein [Rhodovarius sp.]|uniref:ParB/RepB/Spo0J family partition protein n=1 Tax=Rhodovarius sp. TaxID=2972673 RepID=UPI0034A238D5
MTKPPRLGKGLSALLGDVAEAAAHEGVRTLPVTALEPGPFQARGPMDADALEELAASIRRHGVLQPILVRPRPQSPGRYEIIGGERRWRAAQAAHLHEVPVVVRDFDDREAMAAGLVENLQREDLNALEEAEGYHRLIEQFGLTQQALSEVIGKSRPHIANTLRLLSLPERVRDLLRDGALTAGHARAVLAATDPVAVALQVVDRGLNVRQAEALANARPAMQPERRTDPETRALERELSQHLGLQVAVQHNGKSGQVVIKYRNLDQLDGLIRLLKPEG